VSLVVLKSGIVCAISSLIVGLAVPFVVLNSGLVCSLQLSLRRLRGVVHFSVQRHRMRHPRWFSSASRCCSSYRAATS
jgi:hypothetical protein